LFLGYQMQVQKNSQNMLISNPEFKTSACCVLILTIIVANSASGAALEGQVDDRSTDEEHQDWRQPFPTVSILAGCSSMRINRSSLP